MNYLFRYLSTLTPSEFARLDRVEASPRERETLALLISMREDAGASRQEALDLLRMSPSMFDKTCSTALRKLLDQVAPQGGAALLEHLADCGVYDLFLHELRRWEKECLKQGDRESALRFHAEAFRALHLRFNSDYPERLARRIAVRYARLDPSPDTAIHIEATLTSMAVWIEASRRTGGDARERLERRLHRNDRRITETTGARARFSQLKAWIGYYGQLKRDPDRRMACLQAAVDLCERYPDLLSRRDRVLVLCQMAEEYYYYRTDHATPHAMYRELYRQYPDIMKDEDYHAFKYIQLCLINGEFDEGERTLTGHFGGSANMVVHGGGRSKDVALLWTKLLLLTDRLDDARRHLDDAVMLNQKGFYLQFEVECRMLHTALCVLAGDFDLVERRLPAHLKFLRSKGITYKTSRFYPWFFKLVGAIIDERVMGKKFPSALERKLEEYMEGAAAQYGVLLRKLRERRS